MNKMTFSGYERVSKARARRLYDAGEEIRIVPCGVNPVNHWGWHADARKDEWTQVAYDGFNATVARGKEFDAVVDAFAYYNCGSGAGRYPAFYRRTA